MKTIKQIADEIGVTKQAVWKRMNNQLMENLQGLATKKNNTLYISEEGEQIIKQAFHEHDIPLKAKAEEISIQSQQLIDLLREQLKVVTEQNIKLTEELSKEREHSRQQYGQILELTNKVAELADNAQRLHARDIIIPKLSESDEEAMHETVVKKNNGKKKHRGSGRKKD